MNQITITIGRGAVGTDRLLKPERWVEFRGEIEAQLELAGFDVWVSSDGTGSWTGDDGKTISEQNHVWVAGIPESSTLSPSTWRGLWREYLSKLAARFDQDAIEFGWGTSELVARHDHQRVSGWSEYHVTWEIDVEAGDEVEAARKAREAQTAADTTATVFDVRQESSALGRLVDLAEEAL